jgi:hypothetical protein
VSAVTLVTEHVFHGDAGRYIYQVVTKILAPVRNEALKNGHVECVLSSLFLSCHLGPRENSSWILH